MSNIVIEELEYVAGPKILKSSDIENQLKYNIERFGLPYKFLSDMSGIIQRRVWDENILVSDIALLSSKKIIRKINFNKNEIGCIINCSVSSNYTEPTISIICHDKLNLNDRCLNFDLNNACLGFTNALYIIKNLLENNVIRYGLIVCGESSQKVIRLTIERLQNKNISIDDFMLEFATLTLGSGSVSMLLCKEEDSNKKNPPKIEEMLFTVDSKHNMLCKGNNQNQMVCKSHEMLKEGTFLVNKTWKTASKEFKIWNDDIDIYIPHQVSMTHAKVLSKYTNISLNKMKLIFDKLGNIGPASWPIGLYKVLKENTKSKQIGILSMGSGFNCSCIRIKI